MRGMEDKEIKRPLFERVQHAEDMTPMERRLADYFADAYPGLAFKNLEEICADTQASTATVTRFVRKLGYKNFRDFSKLLQQEVACNFDSPLQRTSELENGSSAPGSLLYKHLAGAQEDLEQASRIVDAKEFETIADLIADSRRSLFLNSSATGKDLLHYFYLLGKYHRPNMFFLPGIDMVPHELVEATENSVLLTTNFDRYPVHVQAVMKTFKELGGETILITNRQAGLLRRYADHVLLVPSSSRFRFKSRAPMLIVLESLLTALELRQPEQVQERTEKMENLMENLRIVIRPEKD